MPDYPSATVRIERATQSKQGNELDVAYHTIARDISCHIPVTKTQPALAIPGAGTTTTATAILPPATNVRRGDRLVEESGATWAIESLEHTDLLCTCSLRSVEG